MITDVATMYVFINKTSLTYKTNKQINHLHSNVASSSCSTHHSAWVFL